MRLEEAGQVLRDLEAGHRLLGLQVHQHIVQMIQENGCIMFKLVIVSGSHSRHTTHVILLLIDFQSHA